MSEAHRPLAELLDAVVAMVRRYVVLREEACTAATLWIVHTHVIEAFETTPYLAVMSAEKRSGKTRLLDVMEGLVACPWRTVRPSEAVTFRKIEATQPTMMLDEVDTIFREKKGDTGMEGLRALLNAGNRRGTTVDRCTGKNYETLRAFSVFCAKAIAGIGRLPDTVADRSIVLDMVRKTSAEAVAKFRFRDFKLEAAALRDDLAAWAAETIGTLGTMTPEVPETLNDRAAEAWEPLLLLADVAGGRWPERARKAARHLAEAEEPVESHGVEMLRAIKAVFTEMQVDRMLTVDLLTALVNRDGEPWGEWWGVAIDKGDTRGPGYRLAKFLRPYHITSKTMRVDGAGRGKGYDVTDFLDAFARYLPHDMGSNEVTTGQAKRDNAFSRNGRGDNDVPRPDGDELSRRHVDNPVLEREGNGDRPPLLSLAGRHGYPRLSIRPAVSIPAGAAAWGHFVMAATGEDRVAARAALEAIR